MHVHAQLKFKIAVKPKMVFNYVSRVEAVAQFAMAVLETNIFTKMKA